MAATFSALFIDDQYLSQYTPLGQNIDAEFVYGFVESAQDIYIQDLLGKSLYDDLVYKLYVGTTYSTIERELVDLCSKALAYYTVYSAIPHIAIRIRNIGVARGTSDTTSASTVEEMKIIRAEVKEVAEFYAQRVVRWLCDNDEEFPLYNATNNDIAPSASQYDSDIYLDDFNLNDSEIEFLRKYYWIR